MPLCELNTAKRHEPAMYQRYFGLNLNPFTISPDTRFLFLSDGHREAIAHLVYALSERGGFVQLTGDVGLGKTTVCQYIIGHLPQSIDLVTLLNPRVGEMGLLRAICDALDIPSPPSISSTELVRAINQRLLDNHEHGKQTLLIIDEAQDLPDTTLEMVRLMTNLETNNQKLLRVVLIGQTELEDKLLQPHLRQVAQRITARFHLGALDRDECDAYIQHRLRIAGCGRPLFTDNALKVIHQRTGGTPRLINILCDRALMGAYTEGAFQANKVITKQAAQESLPAQTHVEKNRHSLLKRLRSPRRNQQRQVAPLQPHYSPNHRPKPSATPLATTHHKRPRITMMGSALTALVASAVLWATATFHLPERLEQAYQQYILPVVEQWTTAPDELSSTSHQNTLSVSSAIKQAHTNDQSRDLDFRLGIPSTEPNQ